MRTMNRNRYRKGVWLALAALLCLLTAGGASAAASTGYALQIELKNGDGVAISDAEFSLYRVARQTGDASFTPLEAFEAYAYFLDGDLSKEAWQEFANILPAYIAANKNVQPCCVGRTDAQGKLSFEGLEAGLYLVVGQNAELDGVRYVISPSLVALPANGQTQCVILPKSEATNGETTEIVVYKKWVDANSANRPLEVTVQLIGDGEIVDEVKLNKENGWQYRWKNLDGRVAWRVIENPVPDGYLPSYSEEGNLIVITNTNRKTTQEDSSLPQTGLLWWPVPALALSGAVLFCIGWARIKRHEK